jgi:very-short-patch-repair endonuclease
MLSHHSAAEALGLGDGGQKQNGSAVHVTVPATRRVTRVPGLVVHRSRRAHAIRHPARRPPQTRVEETVLDLTQVATTLDEAVEWIARACGRRLTTPARLAAALAARHGVRWRRELATTIQDVGAGCHSLLELRYLHKVERRHGLPSGVRQRARRRRGGTWYDDVGYQQYQTVVELDGRAAHPDEARWRDMHRDNAGVADGLSVLRYGMAGVSERSCEVAAQVARVLLRNGWPGPPRPCGPACPVRDVRVENPPSFRR